MLVDIRSLDYIWCVGRVRKIIIKSSNYQFLIISYLNLPRNFDEELLSSSNRIAKYGFFTQRNDIPKFLYCNKGNKNVCISGFKVNFPFCDYKKNPQDGKFLAQTDSSYCDSDDN